MTDKKISQLDAAAALGGTEMVEVVQAGANVRTTAQAIANLASSSVAAVVTYKYLYSFVTDGGSTGTLVLRSESGPLPLGFIVQSAFIDVLTVLGSGGAATAALATPQSAGDIVAAAAFSGTPWSTAGIHSAVFAFGQPSGWAKMTVSRNPTLTIAGAALNAGIFNLYVQGVMA